VLLWMTQMRTCRRASDEVDKLHDEVTDDFGSDSDTAAHFAKLIVRQSLLSCHKHLNWA
jgi:hypothetical protein